MLFKLTADGYAALATWAAITIVCVASLLGAGVSQAALLALIVFIAFGISLVTLAASADPSYKLATACLTIELISAYVLFFLIPLDYIAILLVIWSAQITWFLPVKSAISLAVLCSLPFLISRFYLTQSSPVSSWLLFALFNVFAVIMIHLARSEQNARETAEEAKEELEAAREMLSEAGKRAEELRLQALREGPAHVEPLTEKEKEILRLAASGCNNKEIAKTLYNSEGTIKNSFSVILGKLGVTDRTQAVVKALSDNLI